MRAQRLTGGEALAQGALEAGVALVTSYPGSPSSEVVEALIPLAEPHGIYLEWSSNERVALEMAIGASIAGRRALMCTKSVGMNVIVDPLMALNLTPVNGGLVILLGDDPGGYGSQNDQDTRPLATLLEMPLLEPSSPAEGLTMMREAFALSERFQTPVIVRETRGFAQVRQSCNLADGPFPQHDSGLAREPWRFVPVPRNVVEKHRALHQRIDEVQAWTAQAPWNALRGEGARGIVAPGFVLSKLCDILGDPDDWADSSATRSLRLLKLGTLYPPPVELIVRFLTDCREVLVLEENEPYIEDQLKGLAHGKEPPALILGKRSGHVPREGELYRWQIERTLAQLWPDLVPARRYTREREAEERPERELFCAGCRYGDILDVLDEVCRARHETPFFVGDPGCLATVAARLHAKYAIGSAVGVADGLCKVRPDTRAVALFGDSAFFHSAIPAICNAAVNGSRLAMVVFDNGATVTSGFQPNPGVGRDALGRKAPRLDIEAIARACGVSWVRSVGPENVPEGVRQPFGEALESGQLTLLVVRATCDRPARADHS